MPPLERDMNRLQPVSLSNESFLHQSILTVRMTDEEARGLIEDICTVEEPTQRLASLCALLGLQRPYTIAAAVEQLQQCGLCCIDTQADKLVICHDADDDWTTVDISKEA